jgi:transcriptional regulator with XRE-family HTH domain
VDLDEAFDAAATAAASIPLTWSRAEPGVQLRFLRTDRGISQRQLAAHSGVDQADISRLERGADARWGTWRRLFDALGYEAVLAPRESSEDAACLLEDESLRRADRAEAGRASRW